METNLTAKLATKKDLNTSEEAAFAVHAKAMAAFKAEGEAANKEERRIAKAAVATSEKIRVEVRLLKLEATVKALMGSFH